MNREQWYALHHARRLWRWHASRLTQAVQAWAERVTPIARRVLAAFEPVLLYHERQRLVATLAKVGEAVAVSVAAAPEAPSRTPSTPASDSLRGQQPETQNRA